MPHRRQIIRDAVIAMLKGQTTVGERVFPTRFEVLRRNDVPALLVYTVSESVDPESQRTAPRELTRTLQLGIHAVVKVTEAVDDELDALALQVERLVDKDPTFGGEASDAILTSTDIAVYEEADRRVGIARLTYAITYYTQAPAAEDVALDDFRTAHVETSLGGAVHPDNRAVDDVTVQPE
jgi:hypothetical protein